MVIRYNERIFNLDELKDIQTELEGICDVKFTKTESLSADIPIEITILLAVPIYYFMKGFFTRLGEIAAETIGEDLKKAYKSFKKKIIAALLNAKERGVPKLRIETHHETLDFMVTGNVLTDNEEIFDQVFDSINEMYQLIEVDVKERDFLKSELSKVFYSFNVEKTKWEFVYAMTKDNRILK
jgi:hypothetical protein